ncbi:MAG TPA: 23S rRNA (guanosine(2251)-2'-O)-methyltransferase RlmB [Elusimicrobiota bacterium]|nr:23S rRNA (guanosine(2251)-2'-O)-methyltransferase RlmB [Elusimicrobiota bacterium]
MNPAEDLVFGRKPVLELLTAGGARSVVKLWLLRGLAGPPVDELVQRAKEKNIVFQWVDRQRLNQLTSGKNHQGVVARVSPFQYADLSDFLGASGAPSGLLLLDGIEDPHNLGAILRSAAFFGAPAVIVPRWRSAGLSGTVAKTAAGALEKVPLIQVSNIAQTIADLKKRNYWVYGADMKGDPCDRTTLNEPYALVIGAEGAGLHRLVRERCDALVSIPGGGGMESLNASCAAGVFLYELFRRRRSA